MEPSTSGTALVCPSCGGQLNEQKQRVPSGVPFAAAAKAESHIVLPPLDGDFEYQPYLKTAAEVIDFWSRVEIPNVVLARCQAVYAANWQSVADQSAEQAWVKFGLPEWRGENPAPDGADVAAQADWEGRRTAAQNSYENALRERLAARPELLDRRDIRPLVRASAMFAAVHRPGAGEDFWDVWDHEIELTSGPTTVGRALVDTGLHGLVHNYIDPSLYDHDGDGLIDPPAPSGVTLTAEEVDRMIERAAEQAADRVNGEIAAKFDEQNRALDGALDELTDNLGQVGVAVIDAGDTRRRRR